MTARAKLVTRIAAKLEGEVSAQSAEAYRRAGADAYDLLVDCEQRRSAATGREQTLWLEDPVARRVFLCSWCAFALQSLGDALLDADYRANPRTVGFVPSVTAQQALLFYEEVEPWLGRARAVQSSDRFAVDVRLPARLPGWVDVEPCPREHLAAMIDACWLLCDHAELAVADLEHAAGGGYVDAVAQVREALAETMSAAGYALRLDVGAMTPELHRRTEATIKRAVERAYRIGQLAVMPDLVGRAPARLAARDEPEFDPWCLTDPDSRALWQRDRQARRAVKQLWRSDPDPRRTLAIQSELDESRETGKIRYARAGGVNLGHYYCCPWAAIYEATRPVIIAGRRLLSGDRFTFEVSAEELASGGAFVRELHVGEFHPTGEVDYCDPRAE